MLKYTPESHCDATVLPNVVEFVQDTLNTINQGIDKEEADQNSKLLSVVESIDGAELLVAPKRRVILDGKVRLKVKGRTLQNIRKRKSHVFIFNGN